jgi:hypothetical protein
LYIFLTFRAMRIPFLTMFNRPAHVPTRPRRQHCARGSGNAIAPRRIRVWRTRTGGWPTKRVVA